MKIAYRYGEMAYWTPGDGWLEIDNSGVQKDEYNNIKIVMDIENSMGSIITDSTVVDSIDLYQAENNTPEVVFSAESFGSGSEPYWIDNFYVSPMVYSLAPHPDSLDYVFAGTPLGVYLYDDSEWTKSLDIEDAWTMLKTDFDGNYLVGHYDEGCFMPFKNINGFYSLWLEPLGNIYNENRKVGQRTSA